MFSEMKVTASRHLLPKGGKNQELLLKEVALAGARGKNRGGRSKRLGPGSSSASRARAAAAFRRDPRELPAGVAQDSLCSSTA
ncbi:Dna Repair Protein Complementing Xp-C Cells [Manis pentadactyla]|nr:Dna Repair Protein Complementing Xp-C Cells [Manis pentadactyla]